MTNKICQTIVNKETGKICGHDKENHAEEGMVELGFPSKCFEKDCTCMKFKPQEDCLLCEGKRDAIIHTCQRNKPKMKYKTYTDPVYFMYFHHFIFPHFSMCFSKL